MSMLNVRKALINDVNTIVTIHCDAFTDFFLTNLGSIRALLKVMKDLLFV